MYLEHNLYDFWRKQKTNIVAHLENGHHDYAVLILKQIWNAMFHDETLKPQVRAELLKDVEATLDLSGRYLS